MRRLALLSSAIGLAGVAHAAPPQVPTDAPYIVLSENFDEPSGYGFCIDTFGPGQSDLMQTHSCKPARPDEPRGYAGNDTRFMYDRDTGQVASYAFEGLCMQVLRSRDLTVFALLACNDHPRQKFIYDPADQTLRLDEDQSLCVSVAAETEPAGPWVKRTLMLESCDGVQPGLKQWTVVAG